MLNVRLKDVILNTKVKIKVRGKGRKQRVVYIQKELYKKIREKFEGEENLFETRSGRRFHRGNIHKVIKREGRKLGWDIHPHTLRHSTAMHLKLLGKSTKYISEYLGHSTTAITEDMYFHQKPGSEVADLFGE